MPTPDVPGEGLVSVEFIHTLFGESLVVNRVWVQIRFGDITESYLQAVAEGASTWWIANMLPLLSSDLVLQLVRATDRSVVPSPLASGFVLPAIAGSLGPAHSANVSVWVRFSNTVTNLHWWNGVFLGGIPKEVVDGNRPTAEWIESVRATLNLLTDDTFFWGFPPGSHWSTVSLVAGGLERATAEINTNPTAFRPGPYINPRRRRTERLVP